MATIGDLVVNLTANTQDFKRGVGGVQKQVRGLGRVVAGVAAGLAGMFATRASISAAQTQIQAEKKLAAVITATGGAAGFSSDQLKQYAADLQKVTNFGDEVTISAAAMLATFKNIKGDTFKGVLALAQDMSAVFGQDLKSSVLQVGKAFDDPIRGASSLRRIGVSLSDAEMERIKLLQESGDLLGAQNVLMEALTTQVGGAAEAMADPITQASNAMGDIGEAVGVAAIELLTAATNATNFQDAAAKIITFIERMTLGFKRFGVLVHEVFKNIGDAAGVIFANMVDNAEKVGSLILRGLKGEGIGVNEIQNFKDSLSNPLEGFQPKFTDLDTITVDAFGKGAKAIPALAGGGPLPPGSPPDQIISAIEQQTDAITGPTGGFSDAGGLSGFSNSVDKQQRDQQFAGAAEAGSTQAFSSMVRNIFGKPGGPQEKTAKNTETLVKKTEETNQLISGSTFNPTVVESFK